jgi:hypothetical protein
MASWWDEAYNAAVAAGFMYPSVFAEQMRVESADFDEDVIYCRYVNDAGAKGIGQIIPIWHPTVDPCDPEAALQYAANWMNSLMNQQGGRVDLALVSLLGNLVSRGPNRYPTLRELPDSPTRPIFTSLLSRVVVMVRVRRLIVRSHRWVMLFGKSFRRLLML